MVKYKAPQPVKRSLQLTGMEEAPATYADTFLVATENETHMSNLFFFQSQISVPSIDSGTIHVGARKKAQCVSHLILSEKGMEALLHSLAENRGYTLIKKFKMPENQRGK
jgi:hypothetical protein